MGGDIYIETVAFIANNFYYLLTVLLIIHIYLAIVFQRIAKRTNSKQSWLAWIPVANFVLYAHIARMRWWPVLLLLFVPLLALNNTTVQIISLVAILVFIVFVIVWLWKILVRINWPGWLVLIIIVPFGWLAFIVALGIAAFSGAQVVQPVYAPKEQTQKQPPMKPQIVKPQRIQRMDKLKKSLGQK